MNHLSALGGLWAVDVSFGISCRPTQPSPSTRPVKKQNKECISQQQCRFSRQNKTKRSFSLFPSWSSSSQHAAILLTAKITLPTNIISCFYAFPWLDVCIRNVSGCLYVSTQWSVICILFKTRHPQTRMRCWVTWMNICPLDLQITTLC